MLYSVRISTAKAKQIKAKHGTERNSSKTVVIVVVVRKRKKFNTYFCQNAREGSLIVCDEGAYL